MSKKHIGLNRDTFIVDECILQEHAIKKRGSQNIYADLEHTDPDIQLLKAGLVTSIRSAISDKKLNSSDAAVQLGLSQSAASRLLRGQFRDVSVESLIRMITKLGYDVDIVVREPGKAGAPRNTIHMRAHPA